MNVESDKEVEKDVEEIKTYVIPSDDDDDVIPTNEPVKSTKPPITDQRVQELDEEEDIFQSMNSDLDKQVAQDMEAINRYISKNGEKMDPMSKRIQFFNNIDSSYINRCIDKTVSNHIFYQHTPLGTLKWHECTQCSFKAKDKISLRDHVLDKHTDTSTVKWYVCPHCSFMSKSNPDLHRHMTIAHKSQPIQKNRCDRCDSNFTSSTELFNHLKEKHEASFKCTQCDFIATQQNDLSDHVVANHLNKLNVSWYKCAQCAYRTVRKTNLDRHIMYKHSMF